MRLQAIRLAFAFTLAVSALCQERPDPAAYAYFFAEIASLKGAVNIAPRIQDAIAISAAEVEILRKIAADCVAVTDSLQAPRRELIFDSRLEFIETGKHSETLEKKLKELDDRGNELVANYVDRLKAALPDASFAKIDAYVRTPVGDRKSLAVMIVRKPAPVAADGPAGVTVKK
jgi:hypothetical protein